MRNIKLIIEYDGTNYAGWQKQNDVRTIQGCIEKAIFEITKEEVELISSGRTDSGVHALGQVANFLTNNKISIEKVPRALNAKLPDDIGIIEAEEVSLDFHARYHSKRKRYRYVIYNSKHKRPLLRNQAYMINYNLDFELMKNQASKIIGEHDFVCFKTVGSSAKTTVRTIYDVSLIKKEDFIILEIEGNGFLYNMVRIIAGTLIDIGRGRIKEDISDIINSKDRKRAGNTAKACGLFLKNVYY